MVPKARFRAIARVQPIEETDEDADEGVAVECRKDGDTVVVVPIGRQGEQEVFEFDHVFGMDSTYRDIHSQELRFVVEGALRGRNSTLFVSGTSTCGKRHMVVGQPFLTAAEGGISGLAERIVGDIYARDSREEWVLSISLYSIYREAICDLLAPAEMVERPLAIVTNQMGHVAISSLSDVSINNTAELLALLRQSIQARESLEEQTEGRDAQSTLVLVISMQCVVGPESAKVHLVDLAGSDHDGGGGHANGGGGLVQQSAAMLGKIFSRLAIAQEGGKSADAAAVDYSGSTLTWLMEEYVQGASSVAVLAVVSPQAPSLRGLRESLGLAGKARAVFASAKHAEPSAAEVLAKAAAEREAAAKAGAALDMMISDNNANGAANGGSNGHGNISSRQFGGRALKADKVRATSPQLDAPSADDAPASKPKAGPPSRAAREDAAPPMNGGGDEAAAGGDDGGGGGLVPCDKCGRKFAAERIAKHRGVCKGDGLSVGKSPRAGRSPRAPSPAAGGGGSAAAAAVTTAEPASADGDVSWPQPRSAARATRNAPAVLVGGDGGDGDGAESAAGGSNGDGLGGAEAVVGGDNGGGGGLVPCDKCGRKFAAERIAKHRGVCKGEGISVGKSPRASPLRQPPPSTAAAANGGGGGPTGRAASRKGESSLEPCPKCGRTFAPDRIEKHVGVCKAAPPARAASGAGGAHGGNGAGEVGAGPGGTMDGRGFGALGADYKDPNAPEPAPKPQRAKSSRGNTLDAGGGGRNSAIDGSPRARTPGRATARGGGATSRDAAVESQYKGKPGELQTILEDVYTGEGVGTGTQIDPASIALYARLPLSADEASARRPAASITVAAETKGSVDDSFSIPAVVRSHDTRVLGLRVSHSAESRRSHEILNGPDEMVAILTLINESYSDEKFWDKKKQGGMNNPVVAMIHNMLVRIRRFHRMLEDTQMVEFADPVIEAMLRMYGFCTTVMTRSGRSALYNQAVKHVGEFFCYRFVSPPILAAANLAKRGGVGTANATLRDGIAALFALLIKGELNDASRAALRESLRCVACSWAPPLLLCEVALDAMTENLKNRDPFAMRTREMGLTIAYMVLSRYTYAAVKKLLDAPDRPTGQPSKLHTLCACMGMARAEASKSPLNKALTIEIGGLLKMHVGEERFQDTLESADIDRTMAAEILKAPVAKLDPATLKAPPASAPSKSPRPPSPSGGKSARGGASSKSSSSPRRPRAGSRSRS